jgi:hypothetical protein
MFSKQIIGSNGGGGGKKLNEILIKNSGFSKTELIISEGEVITF